MYGIIDGYYGSCSGCDSLEAFYSNNNYNELSINQLCDFGKSMHFTPDFDLNSKLILTKWNSDSDEKSRWLYAELKKLGCDVKLSEEEEDAD